MQDRLHTGANAHNYGIKSLHAIVAHHRKIFRARTILHESHKHGGAHFGRNIRDARAHRCAKIAGAAPRYFYMDGRAKAHHTLGLLTRPDVDHPRKSGYGVSTAMRITSSNTGRELRDIKESTAPGRAGSSDPTQMHQLNAAQRAYVTSKHRDHVVIGNPGTGKTTAMIERIRWLTLSNPGTNIMVITLFRGTCATISKRLGGVLMNIHVRTFHSIAASILVRGGTEVAGIGTLIVQALHEPDDSIASYFRTVGHIFVDEAQTLSRTMTSFLARIRSACATDEHRSQPIAIDIIGDPNQAIVPDCDGAYMLGLRSSHHLIQLVCNYRSAPAIVRFCNADRPYRDELDDMTPARSGHATIRMHSGSGQQQCDTLMALLLDDVRSGRSAGILCPFRHSTPGMADFISCQHIRNVLETNQIVRAAGIRTTYDEGAATLHSSGGCTGLHDDEAAAITVSTIHGSLGHEYDSVYLMSFHHRTHKRIPTRDDHAIHAKMWHVAKSRARDALHIFCSNTRKAFFLSHAARAMLHPHSAPHNSYASKAEIQFRDSDDDGGCEMRTDRAIRWSDHCHMRSDRDIVVHTLLDVRASLAPTAFRVPSTIADGRDVLLPEWAELRTLYGTFAESIVANEIVNTPAAVTQLLSMCDSHARIEDDDSTTLLMKCLRLRENRMCTTHRDLIRVRERASMQIACVASTHTAARWGGVLQHLARLIPVAASRAHIHVHIASPGRWFVPIEARHVAQAASGKTGRIEAMWRVCLFWWQYENEAAYRWCRTYDGHLRAIAPFIPIWRAYGKSLRSRGAHVQVWCEWPSLRRCGTHVRGVADVVVGDEVVELKLSSGGLTQSHAMQVAGYAHMLSEVRGRQHAASVVNLFTGESWRVDVGSPPPIAVLNAALCGPQSALISLYAYALRRRTLRRAHVCMIVDDVGCGDDCHVWTRVMTAPRIRGPGSTARLVILHEV